MTDELVLYQGNLTDVLPKSGVDYLLKFKTGKGIPTSLTSEVRESNPSGPKNGGELESWRSTVVVVMFLLRSLL